MRKKWFLAAILLGVVLCFVVSGVGYGEVKIPVYRFSLGESLVYGKEAWWPYIKQLNEDLGLLRLENDLLSARIAYMMRNPITFASVTIWYDSTGSLEEFFPKGVNTKEKIYISIIDIRGYFSDRSGVALKEAFKMYLDAVYSFIDGWATDMNTDIVARFVSKGGILLGYFYQGEYDLWEE